jgi:gas vesicle protein
MRNEAGSNILWLLAGFAVGASAAMLFAPASGGETRRFIGRKAIEGKDELAHSGREWIEKGRDLFERGRHMADEAAEMFDEGRKMVEDPSWI